MYTDIILDEVDKTLIEDFLSEYEEEQLTIRSALIALENNPDDNEVARELFRSIHSLKSNLHMIGLGAVSIMIHYLENLLDAVRNDTLKFNQLLSDLILVNTQSVLNICIDVFNDNDVNTQLFKYIEALAQLENKHDDNSLISALLIFDPGYAAAKTTDNNDIKVHDDLTLFSNLAHAMEHRVVGKIGSTQRIMDMSLAMNELAGSPVDVTQLQTAVYMHDLGMAFLPLSLLNKTSRYDENERSKLFAHPSHAASMLDVMEHWGDASLMVQQHHERFDGTGYPNKLPNNKICDGAKILSIADTFESMSQIRADREHKRTVLRIVAEVNANGNLQFDPTWVDVFNKYIRKKFLSKKS